MIRLIRPVLFEKQPSSGRRLGPSGTGEEVRDQGTQNPHSSVALMVKENQNGRVEPGEIEGEKPTGLVGCNTETPEKKQS